MDENTNTPAIQRVPQCAWCGTEAGPLRETPATSLNCRACEHRHLLISTAGADLTRRLLNAVHAARVEWAEEWSRIQAEDGSFIALEGGEETGWLDFKLALTDEQDRENARSNALYAGKREQYRNGRHQA